MLRCASKRLRDALKISTYAITRNLGQSNVIFVSNGGYIAPPPPNNISTIIISPSFQTFRVHNLHILTLASFSVNSNLLVGGDRTMCRPPQNVHGQLPSGLCLPVPTLVTSTLDYRRFPDRNYNILSTYSRRIIILTCA